MTAQSSNGARGHARGAWRWKSTDQAQRIILAAARELFTAHGFSNVTVADITARADVSVGSHHHFGGKDQLYLRHWRNYGLAHDQASIGAVAAARHAGITDPAELLTAGARAVLEQTWARRDLAGLFFAGDGPPGFEALKHDHRRRLSRHVDMLLQIPHTPGKPALRHQRPVRDRQGRPGDSQRRQPEAGPAPHRRRPRAIPPAHDWRPGPPRRRGRHRRGPLSAVRSGREDTGPGG
jgi:AcrR family transcriptional regulator